ncbi:hypothetical protein HD806DRAFT_492854 [Xylariaceae sp. AK1471]|nr:hypothetical protein HD806DRAFT_492854 [Xylariaceae sp. AK1471]
MDRSLQRLIPGSWDSEPQPQPTSTSTQSIEDVFLVVVGVTGTGKSTFVSRCAGQQAKIGDSLESCKNGAPVWSVDLKAKTCKGTKEVEKFTFMHSTGIRIHLVDSPGFDDTNKSDSDILKDIANWMASSYKEKNQLLSGILMLHRVSDVRMTGGAMRNLQMFQKLCGRDCFQALTLATTFWANPPDKKQEAVETELQSNYWSDMLSNGATYVRHDGTPESARKILDIMVNKRREFKTNIQVEMVEKGMRLDETSAGRQLDKDLIEAKLKYEVELHSLRTHYENALQLNDKKLAERYSAMEAALSSKIDEANSARTKLEIDIARLQQEKQEEMVRAEERLKQQFKAVNERQKHYKAQLNASDQARATERAALEKELATLRRDLEQANRKKACRPTGDGKQKYRVTY